MPLTQPSLVPPSAEQSHTSQTIPPQTIPHHYQGAKRGRYLPGLEFDSRVGVSRLQTYPRLAHASSAFGNYLKVRFRWASSAQGKSEPKLFNECNVGYPCHIKYT